MAIIFMYEQKVKRNLYPPLLLKLEHKVIQICCIIGRRSENHTRVIRYDRRWKSGLANRVINENISPEFYALSFYQLLEKIGENHQYILGRSFSWEGLTF